METITLQYDASIPGLKGLMASLVKLEGVKKVKTAKVAEPEYDPEFVKKIQRSRKSKGKKIALEDLWN